MDICLCTYILYIFMCVYAYIHICIFNLYMYPYTPAGTHGFTDNIWVLYWVHVISNQYASLAFISLNKSQICLWPHCALCRIYTQLQKGHVSNELLKPDGRHMSKCLKAQEGQHMPLRSHRGVSLCDQTSNEESQTSHSRVTSVHTHEG